MKPSYAPEGQQKLAGGERSEPPVSWSDAQSPGRAKEFSFALSGLIRITVVTRARFARPELLSDGPSGAFLRVMPASGRLPEATRSAGGRSLAQTENA